MLCSYRIGERNVDKSTLKALRGSIRKWQRIAAGTTMDRGTKNCPLCKEFFDDATYECGGCPVAKKTGLSMCRGTPYIPYNNVVGQYERARTKEGKGLALAEVKFLKSLLP
jgi:hypothetical protein